MMNLGYTNWFKIYTEPYGTPLSVDTRPLDSETMFEGKLTVVDGVGEGITSTNSLRILFSGPPDTNRIYLTKIHVNGAYTPNGQDFDKVVDIIKELAITNFVWVDLPGVTNVTNGVVYGTCDTSCKFLDANPSNHSLELISFTGNTARFGMPAQLGSYVLDTIQASTNLSENAWTDLASFTNYITPTLSDFSNGWKDIEREVNIGDYSNVSPLYFRLHRETGTANFFGNGYSPLSMKSTAASSTSSTSGLESRLQANNNPNNNQKKHFFRNLFKQKKDSLYRQKGKRAR